MKNIDFLLFIILARYISYGCHCHLGPDVPRTTTRVKSIDSVDEVCRRQTMCMQCAKIDNGADCQGGVKGYRKCSKIITLNIKF